MSTGEYTAEHIGAARMVLLATKLCVTSSFKGRDEFGCEIPEEVADSMLTVGDVIKFLETTARIDISPCRNRALAL